MVRIHPLKILMVIEKNSWMDSHLASSLEDMGNKVTRFYYGRYVWEFYGAHRYFERKKKNQELLNIAKKLRDDDGLDLIFCYVYDDFLLLSYAKALSNLNIPMVNYNVDMPFHWYRQIRIAPYFDIMLCGQIDNMQHLAKYARKVMYFPMAAKLSLLNTASCQSFKTYEVTFIGSASPYRRHILSELIRSSVPLSIFGKYWDSTHWDKNTHNMRRTINFIMRYAWPRLKAGELNGLWNSLLNCFWSNDKITSQSLIPRARIKGEVPDKKLSTLFYHSKINIGLTRYKNNDLNVPGRCQTKLRDFEIPMAGGFYLVEKSPGYDQSFLDGKEVVTWQTFPELLEKIHYYLKYDNERIAIAKSGQERAMRDHTWEKRFSALFAKLGLVDKK